MISDVENRADSFVGRKL